MYKKKSILFVIDNLNAGGAERVLRTLVENINKDKYNVKLVLFNNDEQRKNKYPLPESVDTIILGKKKYLSLSSLVRTIRKEQPDIVFSTLAPVNILTIIAKLIIRDKKTIYIIRETTIKSISIENTKNNIFEKKLYRFLIKTFYSFADSIISLSEGAKFDLIENFNVKEDKIKVIYNPQDIQDISNKSLEKVNSIEMDHKGLKIVTVGSLVKSKGHKYLIDAIEILNHKENYNIKAYFIGGGKMEVELREYVTRKKLNNSIIFMGFKSNPYKYIKNMDIFVLPALWEGFGNVIIESMACGTPVIASDCESGPKEIIKDEKNGLLFETKNTEDLVLKIKRISNNKCLYQNIKENGIDRAAEFDIKPIIKEYEKHINYLE